MVVETDAVRLQYLKDFGVSDATYRNTSAGTTSTIYSLLRKEYLEEEAGAGEWVRVIGPLRSCSHIGRAQRGSERHDCYLRY